MGSLYFPWSCIIYTVLITTGASRQTCTKNPIRDCEGTMYGWKLSTFKQHASDKNTALLPLDQSRGFLQSSTICPTGEDSHCLTFDYRLQWGKGKGGAEIRVTVDELQDTKATVVWMGSSSRDNTNWTTVRVPIQANREFLVKISARRCVPDLTPIEIRNIRYDNQPCETRLVKPYTETLICSSSLTSSTLSTSLTTSSAAVGPTSGKTGQSARKDDDDAEDEDDEEDEEVVPMAVLIGVALACGVLLIGLLALAVVCWRRSGQKHHPVTSAMENEGCDYEDIAGESNQAAPTIRSPPALDLNPEETYSHLNSPRSTPRANFKSQPQQSRFLTENNYNHLAPNTRMTSPTPSQSPSGNAYTEVERTLPAVPEVDDGMYHVLEDGPGSSAAPRSPRPREDKGDYHRLNLGGVGERGEGGGGGEGKMYDGLQGEEGDTYNHVQREGRGEKVIDGVYSHI